MEETNCIDDSRDIQDAPNCSTECQVQFFTSLASNDETLKAKCLALSGRHKDRREGFHMPYCCGSQLCQISRIGNVGQQPIASWLINSCESNSNVYSLVNSEMSDQEKTFLDSILDEQEHVRRQDKHSIASTVTFPAAATSRVLREGIHTVTIKLSPPSTSTIAHDSTASGLPVINLAAISEIPKAHHQRDRVTNEVSSTAKVTIGVSVMVGILAIVGLIAWRLRMKMRFCNRKRISRPVKPSSLPVTPLISPSSSYAGPPNAPLTPPARLQERRFLFPRALSLRRNNRHRRCSDEHSQEWAGTPLSPLTAPSPLSVSRARRSPEEGEHGGITATTTISMTTSPTRPPRDDAPPGTSVSSILSSASTIRAMSNTSTDSTQNRYSGATATQPPRPPPRVYQAPPVVRGLASPGPPPTRALPSLPSDGRTSPLKSPLLPTSPTRRGPPSVTSRSGSSISANEGNGDSQRPWEGNTRSDTGALMEVASQSPRRVRHVRSPLLNQVSLDKIMKK